MHLVWLRLVSKSLGPLRLELELVVATPTVPQLPGLWPHQLSELLVAGDRLRFSIALAPGRKFPAVPTDDLPPEVIRCRNVSPR